MKLPRHLYIVSRRGARLSHAAVGLMRLLKPEASSSAPNGTKSESGAALSKSAKTKQAPSPQ
jgi:hypothetical protein